MLVNHYGITIDTENPITGVLTNWKAEWLEEDIFENAIDLAWEDHLEECKEEDHDFCGPEERGTVLIGFKEVDGMFEVDETAEYSAIVGEIYTQVVRSKYISRCNGCSPCYPGQGDLDTEGNFLTYTLPPDVWGETETLLIEKL
jgi:hypothetical protein